MLVLLESEKFNMVFNRRTPGRGNGGSQGNYGNKRNGGRRGNRFNNKPDFKFQIHDSHRKGAFKLRSSQKLLS